jgi:CrcB protein
MISSMAMVAFGGATGAVLRFLVGQLLLRPGGFPVATLAVNVAGSFAMGVLVVILLERPDGALSRWAPLLLTGVLGGFTTFSAFSLDTLFLLERGRPVEAGVYVVGSVLLSVGALWLGVLLARGALSQ